MRLDESPKPWVESAGALLATIAAVKLLPHRSQQIEIFFC
jgi:hypothetical protein